MPDDVMYNDTGRAYHYPQPLRTKAHIRGGHADTTHMTRLQQELQMTLYTRPWTHPYCQYTCKNGGLNFCSRN